MSIRGRRRRVITRATMLLFLSQAIASVILLSAPPTSLAFAPTMPTHSVLQRQIDSPSSQLYLFGTVGNKNRGPEMPYIIERIGRNPNENVYREIAEMCINVFFKEGLNAKPGDKVPPWKEVQIGYLKALQTGDLQRRRELYPQTNEMFLAYQVEPASNGAAMTQPLILDLDQVQNFPPYARNSNNQEYVRGDLLGFCEITQRAYGLGGQIDETEMMRPILTNLAVSRTARKLGIGSQLLDECEGHVARQWKLNQMILEVEDYNTRALDFYGRRGYDVVFSDPASRRFDVGGLVLRKVRCTRHILRKTLEIPIPIQRAQSASDDINFSFDFFQKFKETVGVL